MPWKHLQSRHLNECNTIWWRSLTEGSCGDTWSGHFRAERGKMWGKTSQKGDVWAEFWSGVKLEGLGTWERCTHAWKPRGFQTFVEGSVHPGLRIWGRDPKAPQRTIRQGLFRWWLSNYYHGQFSRAGHPAPMGYFSILNFKLKKKTPLKQYMYCSEAMHVYGRKWKK